MQIKWKVILIGLFSLLVVGMFSLTLSTALAVEPAPEPKHPAVQVKKHWVDYICLNYSEAEVSKAIMQESREKTHHAMRAQLLGCRLLYPTPLKLNVAGLPRRFTESGGMKLGIYRIHDTPYFAIVRMVEDE